MKNEESLGIFGFKKDFWGNLGKIFENNSGFWEKILILGNVGEILGEKLRNLGKILQEIKNF